MTISVIIITMNEPNLEPLINSLKAQNSKSLGEIIVVNSGKNLIIDGVKTIQEVPPNRGLQLRTGANLAKFENLWFLHSDSTTPSDSLNQVAKALENLQIGCFRVKFDRDGFWMKFIEICSNLRVKWRNIAFGDQGIFVKKEFYYAIGGFKDKEIMEDYEFSLRVKKNGVKFKLLNSYITTSGKKFAKPLKTLVKMQILQHKFRKGENLKRLMDEYQKI
ncbi:MAG: glycosyltransferase family 2 protein [Campylobacter sp.]|nr:glycosyltransferase family 2 protein [Campylobacter sp.]